MSFCYDCGLPAPRRGGPPRCPEHGARWKLVRNACAADVVVVRDEEVLLTRRARDPFRGRWEVPGGMQRLGEHPAQAAHRELWEELQITVRLTGLLGFYIDPFEDGACQTTVFIGETDSTPTVASDEITEWRWFPRLTLPAAAAMAWTHRQRLDDWQAVLAGGSPPALGLS